MERVRRGSCSVRGGDKAEVAVATMVRRGVWRVWSEEQRPKKAETIERERILDYERVRCKLRGLSLKI